MIWSDIPGWTCPVLLRYYDEVAARLGPGSIHVEVGVAYGKSLAYLAGKVAQGVSILGVDSWLVCMGRNHLSHDQWEVIRCATSPEYAARYYLGRCKVLRHLELCRGNSPDVARALDFEVDSVFLDGSHEYESVRADIVAWLPRLKRGGYLAGHDINDHYPGVEIAVREVLGKAGGTIEVRPAEEEGNWGGVWVWRKP